MEAFAETSVALAKFRRLNQSSKRRVMEMMEQVNKDLAQTIKMPTSFKRRKLVKDNYNHYRITNVYPDVSFYFEFDKDSPLFEALIASVPLKMKPMLNIIMSYAVPHNTYYSRQLVSDCALYQCMRRHDLERVRDLYANKLEEERESLFLTRATNQALIEQIDDLRATNVGMVAANEHMAREIAHLKRQIRHVKADLIDMCFDMNEASFELKEKEDRRMVREIIEEYQPHEIADADESEQTVTDDNIDNEDIDDEP